MHIHLVQTRQHVCYVALRFFGSPLAVQIKHGNRFQIFQIQNAMKLDVQTPDASAALLTIILL